MGAFIAARIDDMLRIYGDNEVADARAEAEKVCEQLTPYNEQLARHRGECRAWVEHDAHFIWERRLSNTYQELRTFLTEDAPGHVMAAVHDWATLRTRAATMAVRLLQRMQYPPLPALLPAPQEALWWQFVAIIHECDARSGK